MKILRVIIVVSLACLTFSSFGLAQWTRVAPYIYPTTLTDSVGGGTQTPKGRFHSKIAGGLSNFVLESNVTSLGSIIAFSLIECSNSSCRSNVRARILG